MTSVSELQTELSFGRQIPFSYFSTWMSRNLKLIMNKIKLLISYTKPIFPILVMRPSPSAGAPNLGVSLDSSFPQFRIQSISKSCVSSTFKTDSGFNYFCHPQDNVISLLDHGNGLSFSSASILASHSSSNDL